MVIYDIVDNTALPISHLTSKQIIRQMIYFLECKDVPSHFDCGHNMLPPLSSEYVNTILTQRFLANSWRDVPGFFFLLPWSLCVIDGRKGEGKVSLKSILQHFQKLPQQYIRLLLHLIRQALTAAVLKFLMQIVSLALFIAVVMENALVY